MSLLKKYKKIILAVLGIALFLFIIFLNKEFSLRQFANINYWYLFLSFLSMYLAMILAATRWGWIVNILQNKKVMPYRKYFFYFSLSQLLGFFSFQELSAFGAQAGILLTKKMGFKKIINVYLIDKLFNTINLLIIVLFSVLYFIGLINIQTAAILIIISFLGFYFIISNPKINFTLLIFYLNKIFNKLTKKFPFSKTKTKLEKEDKKIILLPKIIKKIYLLSFTKFFFFATSAFFVFKALNLDINFIQVILAFPIAQLTLVFAITPGGLGILETGWFALLKLIGFSPININTFLIGYRAVLYIALVLITFINYLLFLTVKSKKL